MLRRLVVLSCLFLWTAGAALADSSELGKLNVNIVAQPTLLAHGTIYDVNTRCDHNDGTVRVTYKTCPLGTTVHWNVSIAATGDTIDSGIRYGVATMFNDWSLISYSDGGYGLQPNKVYWDLVGLGCAATSHLDVSYTVSCL